MQSHIWSTPVVTHVQFAQMQETSKQDKPNRSREVTSKLTCDSSSCCVETKITEWEKLEEGPEGHLNQPPTQSQDITNSRSNQPWLYLAESLKPPRIESPQLFQIMYSSAVLCSYWRNFANVLSESPKMQTVNLALKFALSFQFSQ